MFHKKRETRRPLYLAGAIGTLLVEAGPECGPEVCKWPIRGGCERMHRTQKKSAP